MQQRGPELDTLFSINADGSRNAIHPADVRGRFQRKKHLLWYLLLGIYLLLPWLRLGGHPALLIDIEHRHFYLLGQTYNAQDFWLAFFLVSGLGFALFLVAALFGRLWCGYACPQTVFLEGVFRRLERWIEGSAATRRKLDRAPLTAGKLLRRGIKLTVFFAISAVIAHALLGYFMPVEVVVAAMTSAPGEHLTAFLFALAATLVLFVNFTWFREQLCIVVCPYGRLQGALYDQDTLVVGYDRRRGEPRGAVSTPGAADCVDCARCVAVCPTGIDIRNGTQMECVGCANCIDACDEVMHKLGRPPGLVRYDSQRGFATGSRRFVRPRLWLYGLLLLLGIAAFAFAATERTPFEARLQRVPGTAFVLEQGQVRNDFVLHLVNKLPAPAIFAIRPLGPAEAEVTVARAVQLDSLQDARIPVRAVLPAARYRPGLRLELQVATATGDGRPLEFTAAVPLLGPTGAR